MRAIIVVSIVSIVSVAGCVSPLEERAHPAERGSATFALHSTPTLGADVSVWSGPITATQMECFWSHGVRHVIVGTQELSTARQQIEMAIAHGMSVDTYVYLVWSADVRTQVESAVAFSRDYPVGHLWLDAEGTVGHLDRGQIERELRDAIDACGSYPCGIYTGGWWWRPTLGASSVGSELPLWYALYDRHIDLAWGSSERFGGWTSAYGKQYDGDLRLCDVDADLDYIHVSVAAARAHVDTPAPSAGALATPTGLTPSNDAVIPSWIEVGLVVDPVPGATAYDFEVQSSTGGAPYAEYFVYSSATETHSFAPRFDPGAYRFRARTHDASDTSDWSDWSYFQFGAAVAHPAPSPGGGTGSRPSTPSSPSTPSTPSSPPGGAASRTLGTPTPADGASIATWPGSVTLSRREVVGATGYVFDIEYEPGSGFVEYFTYTTVSSSRTFYPAIPNTLYRWRERVTTLAGPSAWSDWATFAFGRVAAAPPPSPSPSPAPSGSGSSGSGASSAGGLASSVSGDAVTLSCAAVTSATAYEFAIDVASAGAFAPYYAYRTTAPTKTFYPATRGAYRFRVRASTAAGPGAYSNYATFTF